MKNILVWVLAFQWWVIEHINMIKKLKQKVIEVRNKNDIDNISHLIIPWGESTVISKHLKESWLDLIIKEKYKSWKLAIYWTCAWCILLAKNSLLQLIDIEVERNAYWSQIDSFNKKIKISELKKNFDAIFIRAPIINKVWNKVQILAQDWDNPILCKQERILVSTFHPELSDSTFIHKYFLNI